MQTDREMANPQSSPTTLPQWKVTNVRFLMSYTVEGSDIGKIGVKKIKMMAVAIKVTSIFMCITYPHPAGTPDGKVL